MAYVPVPRNNPRATVSGLSTTPSGGQTMLYTCNIISMLRDISCERFGYLGIVIQALFKS